jgi:lactam utilization protein B
VFYFKKDPEQMATTVCAIVSKTLSINAKAQFVDTAAFGRNDLRRFVLEQSGLDLQLYLLRSQK